MSRKFKLNQRGRIAIAIILLVIISAIYFIGKGLKPKNPFKVDVTYNCILIKPEDTFASTSNPETYVSYGVYCPDVIDSQIKINFWREGGVFKVVGDKTLPILVELEGKNFEFVKKGEWEYKE